MFLKIQDGDYTININQISDIDTSCEDCWTVTMASGNEFDCEGEDLEALKQLIFPKSKTLKAA